MPALQNRLLKNFNHSLSDLLFPEACAACGEPLMSQEELVCSLCHERLPLTGFHKYPGNPVEKLFWGRVDFWRAASLLFFNKGGNVQRMVHALKYSGRTDLGVTMGHWLGREVFRMSPFANADFLVPVPLHPSKLALRGYNQCDPLIDGITEVTGIAGKKRLLSRTINNPSQTTKGRFSRWLNVDRIFRATNPGLLSGKSIIIIDDVVTTGATLEACALACLKAGAWRVGLVTLACV